MRRNRNTHVIPVSSQIEKKQRRVEKKQARQSAIKSTGSLAINESLMILPHEFLGTDL